MDVNMACLYGYHTVVMVKQPVDHYSVGLSASLQKKHLAFRNPACIKDCLPGFRTHCIMTVTGCMEHIGLNQACHHFRMRADHIIAVKICHSIVLIAFRLQIYSLLM